LLLHRVGKLRRRYRDTQKRQLAREVALGGDDSGSGLAGLLAAGTLSPSGQAMENEQDQALQAALGRLPEDYRRVITLRYEEQLPFEEIGRLLERSPDAARKLWARAVERLFEELDPPP
jgi:RNA polymerase sigma-70 factor (ECF subfamily)